MTRQQLKALPATSAGRDETLDALPYIDDINYTESHRQLALQLIQAECRNYPPTSRNYLRHFPEPRYDAFLSPRILEQFAKITERKELEKIDMKRYEAPAPSGGKVTDKRAWQNAIQNCKAQLDNQHLRRMNLEIMEEYGPEAFLQCNKHLQKIIENEESYVAKIRQQLYEINARRKRSQIVAGEELDMLGRKWVELVTKNARMQVELAALEDEVHATAKRLKVEPGIEPVVET